jgi:metallo-beta-lactamase class B
VSLQLRARFLAAFILAATSLIAQRSQSQRAAWNKPFPPFRIVGNIYYVGASGVSSFLITTPKGDILLDGGLPETAPQIEDNVRKLGFRIRDVRYLLNSHAHFDHAGGLAALKRASGAQLIASEGDSATLTSGHQVSYGPGQSDTHFPAVAVAKLIRDGESITLAGTTLTAHLTPGHTRGCTNWSMPVTEAGKTYQVVFYCSTSVAGNLLVHNRKYPQIEADYRASFAKLRSLPCDVFLGPHPEFFRLEEKVHRLQAGGLNPFIDPGELHRFIDQSERDFEDEVARQRAFYGRHPKAGS